jgi:homoserine kinase
MASDAAARFFGAAGVKPFAFHWQIEGEVPQSRGLGSSVTVRLGVLHALNELTDRPLTLSSCLSFARNSKAIPTTLRLLLSADSL